MTVDPEVNLVCLGDINGRLKILEPKIETDTNGKMVEEWTEKRGLHHLNQSEKCIGTYTYGKPGKPRSAIGHILVNDTMVEKFKGMHIDENVEEVNMSDHNLVRAWFNLSWGRGETTNWKQSKYEKRTWYKKDPQSLQNMEEDLTNTLGRKNLL